MKREKLATLRDKHWERVVKNDPLKVCIIPSGGNMQRMLLFGGDPEEICTDVFIDFRGFTDKGVPVPNTLEARMELFEWNPVKQAIQKRITELQQSIVEGEESAA